MTVSDQIDKQINDLGDWRTEAMTKLRKIINAADPTLTEEIKWDTPVWTKNGNVCAIAAFKDHVKINFFKGAKISDPDKLFNNGLESKTARSIDFFEKDVINETALAALVKSASNL